MEPKKLNKKLQLNKKIISDLDKIKAGVVATNGCLVTMPNVSASIGVECGETAQINCITKTVDIPTIGHDDGNNCLSHSDWGWCWCKGI